MAKDIIFGRDAKEKLLNGAEIAVRVVGSTLGPRSSNVGIERPFGAPQIIHDGVSACKEIDLEDSFENMGAQLVKEAAQKTNDLAGDGTTTATILTHAIASEAIKNIAAGSNAMMLRKGIEMAVKDIVTALKDMSQKIKTNEEIKQIATISAQDETIGSLIAGAIEKLGKDCVIAVEESNTIGMNVEYKEDMQFDKGWVSPYLITNPQTMEAVIDEPYIVITDAKLTTNTQFVEWARYLENLYTTDKRKENANAPVQMPKNIVFVVGEVSGIALASIIQNKIQGFFNVLAVQAPQHGDKQKEFLQDLAIVTGGTFISEETGGSLATMKLEDYGHAKKVVSTKDSTMVISGEGNKEDIKKRVERLEHILSSDDTSEFEKESLKERIAKLTSGIAVINVGAPSEMEMREKKERCIDAIEATKAAIEEGIVPGGEVVYLYAGKGKKSVDSIGAKLIGDIGVGYDLVIKAVKKPFQMLMSNSGYDAGQMLEKIEQAQFADEIKNIGLDVIDGQIKDMIKAGIIDPVKVSRTALENAASCAASILTTNSLVVTKKEKEDGRDTPPQP